MYDDGTSEDLSTQGGLGTVLAGREQNRQRRAAIMEQNAQRLMQPGQGFGPLQGLMSGTGLGGSPQWDALFGALQGKENAVEAQGGNFRYDPRQGVGTLKREALYTPMWDITKGEQSAVGEAYKDSEGNIGYRRRNPAVAGLQGVRF